MMWLCTEQTKFNNDNAFTKYRNRSTLFVPMFYIEYYRDIVWLYTNNK